MKKALLYLIIIGIFVSGCAGIRRDMTKDYYNKYTCYIDQNYQKVYKNMLEQIRKHYRLVWIGNRSVIENDLYPDIKYGKIRASNETMITGEWCQIQIEIQSIKNETSKLIIYTSKHGFHECPHKDTITEWIKEIKNNY